MARKQRIERSQSLYREIYQDIIDAADKISKEIDSVVDFEVQAKPWYRRTYNIIITNT